MLHESGAETAVGVEDILDVLGWSPYWECHIEADWLVIWGPEDDTLILVRTGTHADLFD